MNQWRAQCRVPDRVKPSSGQNSMPNNSQSDTPKVSKWAIQLVNDKGRLLQ
jgi:hypothetical protein